MTRVPAPIAHSAPFTRCAAGYFLLGPKFETGGRAKIGGVLVASKPTPPELHGVGDERTSSGRCGRWVRAWHLRGLSEGASSAAPAVSRRSAPRSGCWRKPPHLDHRAQDPLRRLARRRVRHRGRVQPGAVRHLGSRQVTPFSRSDDAATCELKGSTPFPRFSAGWALCLSSCARSSGEPDSAPERRGRKSRAELRGWLVYRYNSRSILDSRPTASARIFRR